MKKLEDILSTFENKRLSNRRYEHGEVCNAKDEVYGEIISVLKNAIIENNRLKNYL